MLLMQEELQYSQKQFGDLKVEIQVALKFSSLVGLPRFAWDFTTA
jgi:hypothetical protein